MYSSVFSVELTKEVVNPPKDKTYQKMTKIRFIKCVATNLASGCCTLHKEFSQKYRRISQAGAQECEPVSEKTEDYLEPFVSFRFSFTEQSYKYLRSKIREDLHFEMPSPVPQILLESASLSQDRHKFHPVSETRRAILPTLK